MFGRKKACKVLSSRHSKTFTSPGLTYEDGAQPQVAHGNYRSILWKVMVRPLQAAASTLLSFCEVAANEAQQSQLVPQLRQPQRLCTRKLLSRGNACTGAQSN